MKPRSGFVLIEIAVVFGMLATLTIMTMSNVFGSKRTATLTGVIDTLVADIKTQQMKAISGAQTGGTSPLGYGVHINQTSYTLFPGLSYSAVDPANTVISIDDRVTFSDISLPNGNIIFASRSGEYSGYDANVHSFSLHHIDSGKTKTIQINRYGIITTIE